MKKVELNISLLKDAVDFDDRSSFIKDYDVNNLIDFDAGDANAFLYHKEGFANHPAWVRTFASKIGGANLEEIIRKNTSNGIVLYIKVRERIFAITWGVSARFVTIVGAVDKKFGIYVANKIKSTFDDVMIKSAQSRVKETNPVNKERQFGDAITDEELRLLMEDNESFNELSLIMPMSNQYKKVIGKYSSLKVQFIFGNDDLPCLPSLPNKLQGLLDIYNSVQPDDVRSLFKGLFPVSDEKEQELNEALGLGLKSDLGSFFLFEPEVDFDFSSVSHFKYIIDGDEYIFDSLMLDEYQKNKNEPEYNDLLDDVIAVVNEDDAVIKEWSVFDCLYGEMPLDGVNYILSNGEWFEVPTDKYQRINDHIDEIIDDELQISAELSNAILAEINREADLALARNGRISKERILNRLWCADLDGEFFDEVAKQVKVYEDKFEVCDIYLPEHKKFIHVKKDYGVDALSHLFNQGFVSASSLKKFPEQYLPAVNQHITEVERHIHPNDGVNGPYCVHYVIIPTKRANRLTFFSKMTLESRLLDLRGMGFVVKLTWLDNIRY